MIKKSDLKSVFGKPGKGYPIFFSAGSTKNDKVYGPKSDILKYPANLCSICNNKRTQNHDIAWETLSESLRRQYSPIVPGKVIRLNRIFPFDATARMRDLQLYFTKQLGCRIAVESIPIDLAPFSKAILRNRIHPNIFLTLGLATWAEGRNLTGMSEIKGQLLGKECVAAAFIYHVNELAVTVSYIANITGRIALPNCWHPAFNRNRIVFNNYLSITGAP